MSANKLKSPLQIEEEVAEKIKLKQQKKPVAKAILSENKLREPVEEKIDVAVKEEDQEKVQAAPKPKKKNSSASRGLIKVMNLFGFFERNQIVNAMPFILFITGLIMVYIANSYYAEGVIRDIDKIKVELKESRAEYISTMSRLMYQSKQSEVAKSLLPAGIKESTEPPKKIFYNPETGKKKHTDGN
jgi:Tfp pilus assembly protein PilP